MERAIRADLATLSVALGCTCLALLVLPIFALPVREPTVPPPLALLAIAFSSTPLLFGRERLSPRLRQVAGDTALVSAALVFLWGRLLFVAYAVHVN